jgi:hypothetical protein
VSDPGTTPAQRETSAFFCPRKIGTNWFIPALVKSRFGESGIKLEDGTRVWCFSRKKSRNDCRICALFIIACAKGSGL